MNEQLRKDDQLFYTDQPLKKSLSKYSKLVFLVKSTLIWWLKTQYRTLQIQYMTPVPNSFISDVMEREYDYSNHFRLTEDQKVLFERKLGILLWASSFVLLDHTVLSYFLFFSVFTIHTPTTLTTKTIKADSFVSRTPNSTNKTSHRSMNSFKRLSSLSLTASTSLFP